MEELSIRNLEIIETHREIIERDSREISNLWKLIPMFFYFICAISGYGCSILFYIFWIEIFGGNCPIWAKLEKPIHSRMLRERNAQLVEEEGPEIVADDWRKNLIITFNNNFQCQFFFFIALSSCSFGIIWFMLISRCGKGGYDTRISLSNNPRRENGLQWPIIGAELANIGSNVGPMMDRYWDGTTCEYWSNVGMLHWPNVRPILAQCWYIAPWRIIPPALLFHLIVAPIVIAVVHNLTHGYWSFTKDLKVAAYMHLNSTQVEKLEKHCDIVHHYLEVHHIKEYDICSIYTAVQILSWMMACSWLMILGILILRVVLGIDFRVLMTKIYKIPRKQTPLNADGIPGEKGSPINKQRIRKIFFTAPEPQRK